MIAKITAWHQEVDDISAEFKRQFSDLTIQELNRKPNAATWSVAENLEHIIAVNQTYFPVMEQLHAGKYKPHPLAKIPLYVNFMGNTLLKSVGPDRRKKMKTLPVWEPRTAAADPEILKKFIEHQEQLKQLMRRATPFVTKRTVISSPANRNILYTVDKAFDIILAHERRHFNQATEAMEAVYENQYNYET
jgi:hypothetical protein